MRRLYFGLLSLTCLLAAPAPPWAQQPQQPQLPPHAFLFGTWIGGRFPAPPNLPALVCNAQPTVIFTADLVMRSVTATATYVQRTITTVQAIPGGADFRFTAMSASNEPFSLAGDSNGFGCPNADTLRVEKRGDNQIFFPNCGEFPYPLYRCGGR